MVPLKLSALVAAVLVPFGSMLGQLPHTAVRLAVGFGVDTAGVPNHEIFTLWRAYLSAPPDCARPSALWSRVEQQQWPTGDLLCPYVYQGFTNFTLVHLAPATGLESTYLIRTLVATVSDSSQDVKPLAFYRVYATRQGGQWVLANALPRVTRAWNHATIGRITFVFPPNRAFSRSRAERTAGFVDSLARAFDVQPPSGIGYYFTDDLGETLRAAGLEFFPLGSDTVGGRALTANQVVFVGSSSNGEGYLHEVAHVVLQPFLAQLKSAGLVQEGLMTWVGGSAGLDFKDLIPGLRRYLDAHPDLTLESIMTRPPPREGALDVGYDGLAVRCKMVYDAGGLPAIRQLASAGREPREVLGAATRLLRVSEGQLDELWRRRVADLAR